MPEERNYNVTSSWKRDSNNVVPQLVRLQHSDDYTQTSLRFLRLCVCAGNEGVVTAAALEAVFSVLASLDPPPSKVALMTAFMPEKLDDLRKEHERRGWKGKVRLLTNRLEDITGGVERRQLGESAEEFLDRTGRQVGATKDSAVQNLEAIAKQIREQQTSDSAWYAAVDYLRAMVRQSQKLNMSVEVLISSGMVKAVRMVQGEGGLNESCYCAAAIAMQEMAGCSVQHAEHVNDHGVSSTIRMVREVLRMRINVLATIRCLRHIVDIGVFSYPLHTVGVGVLIKAITYSSAQESVQEEAASSSRLAYDNSKEDEKLRPLVEEAIMDEGSDILIRVVVSKDEDETLLQAHCVEPMLGMLLRFIRDNGMFSEDPAQKKARQAANPSGPEGKVTPKCLLYFTSILARQVLLTEGLQEIIRRKGVSVVVLMMVRFFCLLNQEKAEAVLSEERKQILVQLKSVLVHVVTTPAITEGVVSEGRAKDIRSVLWAYPEQMNAEPLKTLVAALVAAAGSDGDTPF